MIVIAKHPVSRFAKTPATLAIRCENVRRGPARRGVLHPHGAVLQGDVDACFGLRRGPRREAPPLRHLDRDSREISWAKRDARSSMRSFEGSVRLSGIDKP